MTAVGVREAKIEEGRIDMPWKRKVSSEAARELRRRSTRSEDALWQVLRNRRLAGKKFRRQHRIGPFIVDFCCLEDRLVLEIDGPVHLRTRAADQERQELIEREGYRVIRLPAHLLETDLAAVQEAVQRALQPSLPAPLPHAGEG